MIKIHLVFIIWLHTICSTVTLLNAKELNIISYSDTIAQNIYSEADTNYKLFTIEYMISSAQTPQSDKHNATGMNSRFSAIKTEINLGGYLDKAKQKSAFLVSFGYDFINTEIETSKVGNDLPSYIQKIPDIHHFSIGFIYSQKLKNNWEISGYSSLTQVSDFSHKIAGTGYNANLLSYVQKQMLNFKLGAGIVTYLINEKLKALPIGYLVYESSMYEVELMAPLSFQCNYKFDNKNMLQLCSELNFDGYSLHEKPSGTHPQPDYQDITCLDFKICYDRRLTNKLHCNIGLGYFYREICFLENNREIDKLIFNETVQFTIQAYHTF